MLKYKNDLMEAELVSKTELHILMHWTSNDVIAAFLSCDGEAAKTENDRRNIQE